MDCQKIIHIDMDAFFAAVEQRDNPSLRGRPVIVGGDPDRRGVVATCSYEARKFGVHSAMASKTAVRLCPKAVFVRPRFSEYKEASDTIRSIFLDYTDLVEPLSLDEAYLNVTENKKNIPYATMIAKDIRNRIFAETNLTASAGVSYNKFLAKTASDVNKPDGMTVIRPCDAESFLEQLPIGKFYGIGKATEKKMLALGITKGRELKELPLEKLIRHFGKAGAFYYDIVRGIDRREVMPERIRKSVGKETTFNEDISDRDQMCDIISKLSHQVSGYLLKNSIKGRTVTLKVKYDNFECATRSITLENCIDDPAAIQSQALSLLLETEAGKRKVRLLGVSLSNLDNDEKEENLQLILPFNDYPC